MPAEGGIRIELSRCGTPASSVRISSSRPVGLSAKFAGRAPAEVVQLVPLMYSICGMAQGVAAASAVEAAIGEAAAGPAQCGRRLLVLGECAREHLIRALAPWPETFGEPHDETLLAQVMGDWKRLRAAADPLRRVLTIGGDTHPDRAATLAAIASIGSTIEAAVLGEPVADFTQRRSTDDLAAWSGAGTTAAQRLVRHVLSRGWAGAGSALTAFLPRGIPPQVAAALFSEHAERFAAEPALEGTPRETSAYARQAASPLVSAVAERHGKALLARIVAAIFEITALPGLMRAALDDGGQAEAAIDCGTGRAVAFVETARGCLMHAVEIAAGRISRYVILAPTEWNFHPRGAAAAGLAAIAAAGQDVPELARLFIGALDPCVAFDLRGA